MSNIVFVICNSLNFLKDTRFRQAIVMGYRDAYLFGIVPFYLLELAKLLLFTLTVPLLLRNTKIS